MLFAPVVLIVHVLFGRVPMIPCQVASLTRVGVANSVGMLACRLPGVELTIADAALWIQRIYVGRRWSKWP